MPAIPLHNEPIPFLTLPNWVKAATVCGFNIEPIFSGLGIKTDLMCLEEATITPALLGQAMQACVSASRNHHFPFVLGDTFAFDYLPDIATFLATSPTLRDAAQVFVWVRDLINPMIDFRLEENGDHAALVLIGARTVSDIDRYFIESTFASVARFGRMLTGRLDRFTGLRLRYPKPPEADEYAQVFAVPVHFDEAENAIDMPRSLLDEPLEGSFPSLHVQAERRVQQLLAQMSRRTGLVAAAEAVLEERPELMMRGIDHVAKALRLHPRTLQRRLRAEGESFGNLLGRVRYRLALRALQQPELDLETISERLGFSDRRSFTRAFTRWAGVSPSSFRQRKEL